MSLAHGPARQPSQPDTAPAAPLVAAPVQLPAAETARPQTATGERRGPMRPPTLIPARARLTGWMLGAVFRSADAAALAGMALLAALLTGDAGPGVLAPFGVAALTVVWSVSAVRAYAFPAEQGLARHLVTLAAGFGLTALALEGLLVGFRPAAIPLAALRLWFAASFILLYGLHALWWRIVRRWRALGRLTPNIVVVGSGPNAERLIDAALRSREAAVLGVFDDRAARAPSHVAGVPVLGGTDALVAHRIMPFVDQVVVCVPQCADARVAELLGRLGELPNPVMLYIDHGAAARRSVISRMADTPLAPLSGAHADERRAFVKRLEDLVVGAVALIVAAPLMAAMALAIKLDSPGPVFFRQRRHGFANEEILVWKFRSMQVESAGDGTRQVQPGDPRVTRVGRLIRQTSLDELPQLFNVLKGEMSLVGPRPHAVGMRTGDAESARLVAGYAHRHRLKPGMTGWAAINGSRGPVETAELVQARVALDIEYVERQSLLFDLMIMARTLPCLIGDAMVR